MGVFFFSIKIRCIICGVKLIVANWKSNPLNIEQAIKLAKATDKEGAVIAPPFIFLEAVKNNTSRAKLASQNDFWGNLGAYTGEISSRQLLELGVEYVIIGHSERRKYLKETDELINNKVIASLDAGLKVILCVGESSEIRNKGINHAKLFVEQQLDKDLIGLGQLSNIKDRLLIAYEPIWAIGTMNPDTPDDAEEMARHIKSLLASRYSLKVSVLYGGSVNSLNSASFLNRKEIDGALVGGSSLDAEEFNKIRALSE